jgi:general secretion pathway protein D
MAGCLALASLAGSAAFGQSLPASGQADASRQATELLSRARQHVANGRNDLAEQAIREAETLGVRFDPLGDTPAKIRAEMMAGQQQQPAAAGGGQADALLLQARIALAHGDVRRAEQFIVQAQQVGPAQADTVQNVSELVDKHRYLLDLERRGQAGTQDYRRARYDFMLRQAHELMSRGRFPEAERLASDSRLLGVNTGMYNGSAEQLLDALAQVRRGNGTQGVGPTGMPQQMGIPVVGSPVRSLRHEGAVAQQKQPAPATGTQPVSYNAASSGSEGQRLYAAGETALKDGDTAKALNLFRQAYEYASELDPAQQQRLRDRLQLLPEQVARDSAPQTDLLDETNNAMRVLIAQLTTEVGRKQLEADRLKETDPEAAQTMLQEMKQRVADATVDQRVKDTLTRQLDRKLEELQVWLVNNSSRLELDEANRLAKEEVQRQRDYVIEVDQRLVEMVDQFNRLMEEERWAEAEQVARRAQVLAPEKPVTMLMLQEVRLAGQLRTYQNNRDAKAGGFASAMNAVDAAAVPSTQDYAFPDARVWSELSDRRLSALERRTHLTEADLEIERRLETPVSVQFQNEPLGNVLETLGKLANINIHVDPRGLTEEGIPTDVPVTLNTRNPIKVKSVLNLILADRGLGFVIKDEVLRITSKARVGGEVYTQVYPVADLVVPIPNFVPNGQMGLAGALKDALAMSAPQQFSRGLGGNSQLPPVVATAGRGGGTTQAALDNNSPVLKDVLAQPGLPGAGDAFGGGGMAAPGSGLGMGAPTPGPAADYDSLIELITTTVKPDSWQSFGGPGSIRPMENNLTLIVSQTQEVHEQIADLLQQLRRLQDLQVTLEVRFITLNDSFFERIGVDLDFEIDDDTDQPFQTFGRPDPGFQPTFTTDGVPISPGRDLQDRDHGDTVTAGLTAPGVFSADLDIPFQQGSFPLATPQFGGYSAGAGATLGFAILSDIETFFFLEASQGDTRSNVLQAPKVTLFNGQVAFVADTAQSPFVISVVPVVGDFAAAFQPVIVVLSEGTFLTVQAVVSNDRRFVRLTLVPFFSEIRNVNQFTFTGSETTIDDTSSEADGDSRAENNNRTRVRTGTTVQLPTYAFVTVTTTVSVPDGGTVLLGGIKRLNEGRNEFGVPILSKVPYVNRLFRNVGIGRETQSLMLMVTPRIIIQEEEEERLIGTGGL